MSGLQHTRGGSQMTGPHSSPSPGAPPEGQVYGPQPQGPEPTHDGSGGAAQGGHITMPPMPPLPLPALLPPLPAVLKEPASA
jgi:hypothetical protein